MDPLNVLSCVVSTSFKPQRPLAAGNEYRVMRAAQLPEWLSDKKKQGTNIESKGGFGPIRGDTGALDPKTCPRPNVLSLSYG